MRKTIIALGLVAAAAAAVPAQANEFRAEVRGGVAFVDDNEIAGIRYEGSEEAIAGVAVGYDFNLNQNGQGAFIGVEGSADKVLARDTQVIWGATARVGTSIGSNGKLFAAGGYTFGENEDTPHLGAGYEHKLGGQGVYLKGEYRHYFSDISDANTLTAGVGFKF